MEAFENQLFFWQLIALVAVLSMILTFGLLLISFKARYQTGYIKGLEDTFDSLAETNKYNKIVLYTDFYNLVQKQVPDTDVREEIFDHFQDNTRPEPKNRKTEYSPFTENYFNRILSIN